MSIPARAVLLLALLLAARGGAETRVYSSYRPVRDLTADGRTLWAATGGGLAELDTVTGRLRLHTAREGLPSHDVKQVLLPPGHGALAVGYTWLATFDGRRWYRLAPDRATPYRAACVTRDGALLAVPEGLLELIDGRLRSVPGPPEPVEWLGGDPTTYARTGQGIYRRMGQGWERVTEVPAGAQPVVAMAVDGERIWLSGGAELWTWDGSWSPTALPMLAAASHLTDLAPLADGSVAVGIFGDGVRLLRDQSVHPLGRRITAITAFGGGVAAGTQSGEVHLLDGPAFRLPEGPSSNNIVDLAVWRDRLWLATFDGGLSSLAGGRWDPSPCGELASPWLRQVVPAAGRLWIRHADGMLQLWDGGRLKTIAANDGLPQAWFSALAADGDGLLAGVWGGLARFDGRRWWTWLREPELRDQVVTVLRRWGDLWAVGTQKQGLLVGKPGHWRAWTVADGLPDPWITALQPVGDRLLVGTFNGGAVWLGPTGFQPVTSVPADATITALLPALLATRAGLYGPAGRLDLPLPDAEVQALARDGDTVWVGTRSGLMEWAVR